MNEPTATRDELVAEARQLVEQAGDGDLTGENLAKFEDLERAIGDLDSAEHRADLMRRFERGEIVAERVSPPVTDFNVNRLGDPWRDRSMSQHDLRGRAAAALDRTDDASDSARSRAAEVIALDVTDRHAAYVLAVSDAEYRSAWAKLMADFERGHLEWTSEEKEAFSNAQQANRNLNITTSTNGGFAVPFTLDPSFEVTGAGQINPIRDICRTVVTTTDQWQGVLAGQISASFDAEAAEVSDDSPVLDDSPIPVHMARVFVPFTIEAGMDIPNLNAELGMLFADAKANLEAEKYTVGSGNGEPTGIVTRLDATTNSELATTTNGTFAALDIYRALEAVPPRHRPRARWMAALPYINLMRQFASGSGHQGNFIADLTAGQPPSLLGKPLHENSFMDLAIGTGTDLAIVVGDFSKFCVVDRVGMSVELVPHLFGAAGRPTGQRGLFAFWRTGSDATDPDAFRLLEV